MCGCFLEGGVFVGLSVTKERVLSNTEGACQQETSFFGVEAQFLVCHHWAQASIIGDIAWHRTLSVVSSVKTF